MKYKVSLLPERNRKRLIGKKKAIKAKSIALLIVLILLANVFILTICFTVAQTQKAKIVALNDEYAQKVTALQQYRDINTNLQNKINLIKSIQVEEPALYNFIATLSNSERPGISITNIDCADWKSARNCVITGKAISREAFNEFIETLKKEDTFKTVDCTGYTVSIVEGKPEAEFTVSIACDGGSGVPAAQATNPDGTPATTAAQ